MTDIPARLTEIHAALVEKIGGQPRLEPILSIYQSGKHCVSLYPNDSCDRIHTAISDSIEEALTAALDYIATMPDPDARAKITWHKKLGAIIDEGHELALPDDVMKPLRASSHAMSKNLLAAPGSGE